MAKQEKQLEPQHLDQLRYAKQLLENPGFAIKASNLLGKPIEKGIELLPATWQDKVGEFTREALMVALKGAVLTMSKAETDSYPWWHKAAATITGAAGGFFGLPALAIELPVSTTIMCRSIADIARSNGESLTDVQTKLACIEVFALGGPGSKDDASETAYFAMRAALSRAVTEATEYLAAHTIAEEGAPALVRLVVLVASRFQVQVTEKAAAQAIPVIGAISGGAINYLFMDHFQDMSRGHFTVRRLERIYGPQAVKLAYERI
ncbi:peptidase (plasmid) [Aquabacterium olei]|uniref:Peptidase n=1 Tax=Aquabacterium olei TaxID=1296669 RepID=A0A2U8FWN9_9BURK|nr:EcsC family protein [Aquabacterium olei]AWI55443.1 peptidase [Aquabacterium olei]